MALPEASKECLYLGFLNEFSSRTITVPINIMSNNQSAQKLMQNPVYHSPIKHTDIHNHLVWNVFDEKENDIKYISSKNMPAGVITKTYNHKCAVSYLD